MSEEDRLTPEGREGKAQIKFLRESKEGFWLDKLEASTDTEEDEVVIEDRAYSEQLRRKTRLTHIPGNKWNKRLMQIKEKVN